MKNKDIYLLLIMFIVVIVLSPVLFTICLFNGGLRNGCGKGKHTYVSNDTDRFDKRCTKCGLLV